MGTRGWKRRTPLACAVICALLGGPSTSAVAADQACAPIAAQRATPSATVPPGFGVSGSRAVEIALGTKAARGNPARRVVLKRRCGDWQVLGNGAGGHPRFDVTVDGRTGRVLAAWGGYQAVWPTARGSSDLFVGSGMPILLIALTLIFIAPFLDPRRPLRGVHLDLLALLAIMPSLIPYRFGAIGWSTPLAFAGLGILAARMLFVARRPTARREPLVPYAPPSLLIAATAVLLAGRVAYNLAAGFASDVGYYSVYGAQSLLDGYSIYDQGSAVQVAAYGPAMHLAYTPFAALFPLPGGILRGSNAAEHAAAVTFDVLAVAALWVLGRRLRPGRTVAAALTFGWTACPLTFYAMTGSVNDGFVALVLILALLAVASPAGRGVFAGLAAAAKWVPVVLVPLFAGGTRRVDRRTVVPFGLAAVAAVLVTALPFIPPGGPLEIYRVSVGDLANVDAPFSIWGLWGLPDTLRALFLAAACAGGLACAFVPRERSLPTVAALGTAIVAVTEMALPSWTYAYATWFAPLALVAICAHGEDVGAARQEPRAASGRGGGRFPQSRPARASRAP